MKRLMPNGKSYSRLFKISLNLHHAFDKTLRTLHTLLLINLFNLKYNCYDL